MTKKETTKTTKSKKNALEEKLEKASATIDEKIVEALTKVNEERKTKSEEESKQKVEEVIKPLNELVSAITEIDEKREKINNINSFENAKEYLTKELENANKLKEQAQKFIRNNNSYTRSWNGINYGDF